MDTQSKTNVREVLKLTGFRHFRSTWNLTSYLSTTFHYYSNNE